MGIMYIQICIYKMRKRMKNRTISKIIRMTPEEKRRLEYCAEKMAKTETEILIAGVNNYYAAVQKALAAQKNQ